MLIKNNAILQAENKPIFIVGSGRSGTSVLTWCLGQHPNILPLPETHWIAKLTVVMKDLYRVGTINEGYSHLGALDWEKKDFYAEFGKAVDQFVVGTREPRLRYIRKQSARKWGLDEQRINELEEKGALEPRPAKLVKNYQVVRKPSDPKRRWVDGTPDNSFHMYGLSLLFPNAKFIHLLRNPDDVARSLMRFSRAGAAGQDYTEREAFSAWLRLTEAAFQGERALGNNKVLRISYENLVDNPEPTLRRCMEFLGEEFSADCLLPLREKINSSNVDRGCGSLSSPTSPKRKSANNFYQIISNEPVPTVPDITMQRILEKRFERYANWENLSPGKLGFLLMGKLRKFFDFLKFG